MVVNIKFKVIVSEGEDGWYVVECPALPGCVSQGKTIEEAIENIKDAIERYLETLNEKVKPKSKGKVMEVTL